MHVTYAFMHLHGFCFLVNGSTLLSAGLYPSSPETKASTAKIYKVSLHEVKLLRVNIANLCLFTFFSMKHVMSSHSQRNMSFYIDLLSAQMCTTECSHLASIDGADMAYCITTHQLWKYSTGLDISCIGPYYSECTTALWSYNR